MILCTGFYFRDNLGDDLFYYIFKNIFDDMKINYQISSLDDVKILDSNIDLIILGGGEILNSYFLSKIQKLTKNFNGKIIAYSCELPQGQIIKEINLIDYFIIRNHNDYQRLLKHFNQEKENPFIEYYPDLVFSYPVKRELLVTKEKKVTVCLARSIFSNNKSYNFYLKKICLFLKYIYELGWNIYLIPFNTSSSNSESDLLLNQDLVNISESLGFKLNNIVWSQQENNIETKSDIVINHFKTSDIIICSRYHAHILSVVCGKPIFSIPHTKKAKEQMELFGLNNCIMQPVLDEVSRPTDFDVLKAIELFNSMIENYDEICEIIKEIKLPTIQDHKNKLERLFKLEKRQIPPYYVSDDKCMEIINDIKDNLKLTFNLENLNCDQNLFNEEFRNRITRFILYKICKDPGASYFYGLTNKILKPNFNIVEDLKWIYNDYYSKNMTSISFNPSVKELDNSTKILNLKYIEPHLLSNLHRSGWSQVVHNTGILHNPDGIIFDMFCDKTFHWGEATYTDLKLIPYQKPWIGIVHHTPSVLYTEYNTNNLIKKESWNKSLSNCIGIYTMSDWLTNWFKNKIPNLFVETLIHPTEISQITFSLEKFMENFNKKLVQIGGWLRNPYSIYRIAVPEYINKCHLIGKDMDNYVKPNMSFEDLVEHCCSQSILNNFGKKKIEQSISQDQNSNKYVYFLLDYIKSLTIIDYNLLIDTLKKNHLSVQLINKLDNDQYDHLLSENIVFIDLIEASACNTLIECIVRNTPILIRPLPSVVERLGKDYPMYWNDYTDIYNLLKYDNIKKTHEYLKNLDKSCYTFDYWINSILNSQIYNTAKNKFNKVESTEIIKSEIKLENFTIVADIVTSNGKTIDKSIELRNSLVTNNSKCKLKNLFKCFCRKRNNIVDST